MPGVVDPHTHYDAQLFWDPLASPSNVHGVTTVIGGNCGFTLAPINAEDADYIRQMMAKVEGMPLAALENGVPWNWSTFGEYLDALDGRLGVNAGFLVGHCALRRKVMGADRGEEVATDDEIAAMRALLADSLAAGGLGFSSSQSRTHSDGDGRPISSRYADRREMLAFCEEVAAHEGTTLEYITNGCLDSFSPEEIDLMTTMSVTAQRPLNWNVLTVDARSADRIEHQLSASSAAAAAGGQIVALTMPTLVPMNMSFRTHCALFLIPGWGDVMGLPEAERMQTAGRPRRARPARRAGAQQGGRASSAGWPAGAPTSSATPTRRPTRGAPSAAWPTSRPNAEPRPSTPSSTSSWPTTCAPCCGPTPTTARRPPGSMRAEIWSDPRAMVGGLRRRRAPRPHVRLELSDRLPRRLPARPQARPGREGGAHDDGAAGPAVRAARPGPDPRGLRRRPLRLRSRDGRRPSRPGSCTTCPATPRASTPARTGSSASWSTASRPSATAPPPGALPGTLLRSGRDTASVIPAPA